MKKQLQTLVSVACLGGVSAAFALEPAPVDLGGFQLIPTLNVTTTNDDNPFSQSNGGSSELITTISPNFLFLAQQGDNSYSFEVDTERAFYHDTARADYTDYSFTGNTHLVFNSRNALDLEASYADQHEAFGTASTQGAAQNILGQITGAAPVEYDDTAFGAKYTYGAASAAARVELSTDYMRRIFDADDFLNQFRDRKDFAIGARVLVGVAPNTDLTFEIRTEESDYLDASAPRNLDSDETEYFIGAEWTATAKTSGYVKVGLGDKDFSDASIADSDSELNGELGVNWAWKEYSVVNLWAAKEEEETVALGSTFIDTTGYGIGWNHDWNDRVTTNVGYEFRNEEYVGTTQDDDTDFFNAGLTYNFDRWLDVGLAYEYSDKSSSINELSFDRSKLVLSFDVSL